MNALYPVARPLPVLLCLSHLRWDFVFQRPQHLMARAAEGYRVVFFEEPLPSTIGLPYLRKRMAPEGVLVATPMLPAELDAAAGDLAQRELLDEFPSSVDAEHFHAARSGPASSGEPPSQADLPRPRVGFFGVLDERIDYGLLDAVAVARPGWQLVMVGPMAKIDPATLPRRPNLHWLGMKPYAELPAYLAGWDAGLMPFALNEATRFISPTKTPEFLAAGVPVVSTSVPDVVADWGSDGLIAITDGPDAVVAAIETVLTRPRQPWLARVDRRLTYLSWTATWVRMRLLIEDVASAAQRRAAVPAEGSAHVT